MKYIFSTIAVLLSVAVSAQLQDSTTNFKGKNYCLHKMQQGETLFQLSRTYKVAYSLIKEGNPDRGDDIALGEIVRVPCSYISPKEPVKKTPRTSFNDGSLGIESQLKPGYTSHIVIKGETVYSLTKKYKVTQEQFFKDNPKVATDGLKIGDDVLVFSGLKSVDDKTPSADLDSLLGTINGKVDSIALLDSTVFRVGILLPFNLKQNKSWMDKIEEGKDLTIMAQTQFFVEFLQGAKMALDSIRKLGVNLQVFAYDTQADTTVIKGLLKRPEFMLLNMIIGPAYGYNFEFLSKKMKGTATYLVSPYGKGQSIIAHNPNAIKVKSSKESRVKVLAECIYANHKKDHLIFTHENSKDLLFLEQLQTEILALSLLKDSVIMPSPIIVKGIYEPIEQLKTDQKNIVVSFSSKESFATKLVVKMQSKLQDYEIVLFGMEEWKGFKNIEVSYWEALSMHIVGNLDYKFLGVKDTSFFKTYFKEYYTEPTYHSVLAYDVIITLLSNLEGLEYNHDQVQGKAFKGSLSNYVFQKKSFDKGLDNRSASVYRYKDFRFTKVINSLDYAKASLLFDHK